MSRKISNKRQITKQRDRESASFLVFIYYNNRKKMREEIFVKTVMFISQFKLK